MESGAEVRVKGGRRSSRSDALAPLTRGGVTRCSAIGSAAAGGELGGMGRAVLGGGSPAGACLGSGGGGGGLGAGGREAPERGPRPEPAPPRPCAAERRLEPVKKVLTG